MRSASTAQAEVNISQNKIPPPKTETWEAGLVNRLAGLVSQRMRPHLELHELARGSFGAFHVEWGSRRDGRVEALPFPAAVRIIDAAVEALCVVAHRIRHAQRYELAVVQHQQTL